MNWESNETRISINQDMPLVARFVRLAGLSSTVSKSRREYLSSRSKFAGIDAKLDVMSDFSLAGHSRASTTSDRSN